MRVKLASVELNAFIEFLRSISCMHAYIFLEIVQSEETLHLCVSQGCAEKTVANFASFLLTDCDVWEDDIESKCISMNDMLGAIIKERGYLIIEPEANYLTLITSMGIHQIYTSNPRDQLYMQDIKLPPAILNPIVREQRIMAWQRRDDTKAHMCDMRINMGLLQVAMSDIKSNATYVFLIYDDRDQDKHNLVLVTRSLVSNRLIINIIPVEQAMIVRPITKFNFWKSSTKNPIIVASSELHMASKRRAPAHIRLNFLSSSDEKHLQTQSKCAISRVCFSYCGDTWGCDHVLLQCNVSEYDMIQMDEFKATYVRHKSEFQAGPDVLVNRSGRPFGKRR